MKPFITVLILFFLSGCTSYNEFAKRKYLKGQFSDRAEKYAPVNFKTDRAQALLTDTSGHLLIADNSVCAAENSMPVISRLHVKENKSIQKNKLVHSIKTTGEKFFLSEKNKLTHDEIPEENPEKLSARALMFGMLSIAMLFIPVIGWILVFVFGGLALGKARRVIKDSTASEKQISRAKAGKIMAIVSITLLVLALALFVLLAYLFTRSGWLGGWG